MRLRVGYALATTAVFAVEVFIALRVRDAVIRPYASDVLAVVLVYLGLRAVTPWRAGPCVAAAVAIAFVIEAGQALHVLDLIGLGGDRVARIVLGGTFDLKDLAAYVGGGVLVSLVEAARAAACREARAAI
ncbi:MAG: DUF2809 domain-containing protein [Caulobacter sp.]|nr:DUF2809 domain-containing protein [Caulobacter sp.]